MVTAMKFTVVEELPDGRQRIIKRGLTLEELQRYNPQRQTWALTAKQEKEGNSDGRAFQCGSPSDWDRGDG